MEGLWTSVDTRSSKGYCYTSGVVGVCKIDYVVCSSPLGGPRLSVSHAIISYINHVNVSRDVVVTTAY